MMEMSVVELIQQFGLPVALVVFFVWQSKIREDRLASRIDSLESYYRDTLVSVVKDNTSVMNRLEMWLERHDSPPVNVSVQNPPPSGESTNG